MDDKKLADKLEGCEPPELSAPIQQMQLKLTLLNAKRSSSLGFVLVALPSAFIFGVLLKYQLGLHLGWFSSLEEWMSHVDHTWLWFVPPLILAGAPVVALALNLLALLHVQLNSARRDLQITLKLKPVNLLICAICLFILGMIFLHVIAERGQPPPQV